MSSSVYRLKSMTADELRAFIAKHRGNRGHMRSVVEIATDLLLLKGNLSLRQAAPIMDRIAKTHHDLPEEWRHRVMVPSYSGSGARR